MYKAIPGVIEAYQSINAQIPIIEKKRPSWRLNHAFEDPEDPVVREKNLRHQEVTQYYSDIENCAARIAAKLRDIDNIDLNETPMINDDGLEVSNQKRFIDDQCRRAQAALPTEFYMRKLNSTQVHREIIDIDERITYNAKNYRTSLIDIGVKEVDIDEPKPAESGAASTKKAKSKTIVKKKQPIGVPKKNQESTFTAEENNDLTMEELDKMNEETFNKMQQTFSFNERKNIMNDLNAKTEQFKEQCTKNTNALIERRKREIRDTVAEKEKQLRALEAQLPVIRAQNEEADALIAKKNNSDYEVRQIVEEHYRATMTQLTEHSAHQYDEIQKKNESLRDVSHKLMKYRLMKEELEAKRSRADPFMRRRAQNLVKGLLQNLDEKDIQIQEEREEKLSENYKQWKEVREMIANSERMHRVIETQCNSTIAEICDQKMRIELEKVSYKEKAREMRQLEDETADALRRLEKLIADKAREEKRTELMQKKAKHASNDAYDDFMAASHDEAQDTETSLATGDLKGEQLTAMQLYIKQMEKKYKNEIRQVTGAPTKAEVAQRRMSKSMKKLMSTDLQVLEQIGGSRSQDKEDNDDTTVGTGSVAAEEDSGDEDGDNLSSDDDTTAGASRAKRRASTNSNTSNRRNTLKGPAGAGGVKYNKRTSLAHIPTPTVTVTSGGTRRTFTSGGSGSPSSAAAVAAAVAAAKAKRPLCDDQTEAILDISAVQSKRQEMTKTKLAVVSSPLYHTAPAFGKSFNANGGVLTEHMAAAVVAANAAYEAEFGAGMQATPDVKWNAETGSPTVQRPKTVEWNEEEHHDVVSELPSVSGKLKGTSAEAHQRNAFNQYLGVSSTSSSGLAINTGNMSGGGAYADPMQIRQQQQLQAQNTPVHSVVCAACYVDCYQREGPVLATQSKRAAANRLTAHLPSFELPGMEPQAQSIALRRTSNVMKQFSGSHYTTNLIRKYCSQQSPLSEGVKVLANILYVLHTAECLSKDKYVSILRDLDNISSAEKLCSTAAEEDEVRYKLHVCCVTVIHETMATAPKTLLVQNSRNQFMEILTNVLGVMGIILNCSLFYWKPTAARNGMSAEKIEMVSAQIVEVILANGNLDYKSTITKRKLPQLTHAEGASSNATPKELKNADPIKLIDSLRSLLDLLLNSVGAENKIIVHPLLKVINSRIDTLLSGNKDRRRESVSTGELRECLFTMAHRHAIYGIQLCLFVTLNEKEFNVVEVNEMLDKAIKDGESLGQVKDSILESVPVIPTNFDDLLLQVNPQIVPALYALELMRSIIEEEFSRARFIEKIANTDKSVSELQFLNVSHPAGMDLVIHKAASVQNIPRSLSVSMPTVSFGSTSNTTTTVGSAASTSATVAGAAAATTATAIGGRSDIAEAIQNHTVSFSGDAPTIHATTEVPSAQNHKPSPHKPSVSHQQQQQDRSFSVVSQNHPEKSDESTFAAVAATEVENPASKKLSVSHVKLTMTPTAPPLDRKKSSSTRGGAGAGGVGSSARPSMRKLSSLKAVTVGNVSGDEGEADVTVGDNFNEFAAVIRPFVPVVQPATRFSFANKTHDFSTLSDVAMTSSRLQPSRDSQAAQSPPNASASPPLLIPSESNSNQTSIKQVHADWLKDVESHVINLSRQIHSLVWNPALTPLVMSMSPTKTAHTVLPVNEGDESTAKAALIPLPESVVYKILQFVDQLQKTLSGHHVDGLDRVEAMKPSFLECLEEIRIARGKILRIVSALSWPMKKRLDWLKSKLTSALNETSSTTRQIEEKSEEVIALKREIDKYRASLSAVEREKTMGLYKKTRQITLMNHGADIQKLILEHATRENYAILQDCKAKEVLLGESLVQFEKDFEQLKAHFGRLQVAHRSMTGQTVSEQQSVLSESMKVYQLNASDTEEGDETPLDLGEQLDTVSKTLSLKSGGTIEPPIAAPPSSPLDSYLQMQRLFELLSEMHSDYEESGLRIADTAALNETLKSISARAKTAAMAAHIRDPEEQRRYMLRLSGGDREHTPAAVRKTPLKEAPVLVHPKVFGFSNRIEAGLMPLGAPPNSPTQGLDGHEDSSDAGGVHRGTTLPSEAELESLAEKMLNGEYEDVVDASIAAAGDVNRPKTTGGVTKKVQRAAQAVAAAAHMAGKSRGHTSGGGGKERLGEMIPVPVKQSKEDHTDRSFLFYMGKSDFSLEDKKGSPVMFDSANESDGADDPFADLLIAGSAPPKVSSAEKPVKLHAPHFEPYSPHHHNVFLKDLKRSQPFKQSLLYPPASAVNSLQPADLMKMMSIELQPRPKELDEEQLHQNDSTLQQQQKEKHPVFDDEDEELSVEVRARKRQQQQPSPMQVVVNYRPKQSGSGSSDDGSAVHDASVFQSVGAAVEGHNDTATNSTVLNSFVNSIAEESESTVLEEQLLELQQVEQLANEEVLSSIAHIQQVHGPSPATSRALGAASMAVASGSLMLARKKSSFSGTLKFDSSNSSGIAGSQKVSRHSSRKKFDKFVLGDPSGVKSRTASKAHLMDSVANNQKLFNWEEIDLFRVDEEDSFLLHNFKFEDDSGGQSIKSHTFINAADGQKREIVASQLSLEESEGRRSSVVVQEKMLNNQIKELLQSEVVVVLEEVPIVSN